MTTNVPPIQFTSAGLIVPQESDILAGVQADFNDAFGGNLNPALETPQGQLASSTAAIIADANAEFAKLVNQIDPDTADGFMQDVIGRIYFINRTAGAPTAVECVCSGAAGVTIPVGAQAQDTSGNLYVCTGAGVIGVGGTVTLQFANVKNGPIPCPANTLTKIFRSVTGWDSINNPTDGVDGRDVETRAEFEFRRKNSVAQNAKGTRESIYAAVFDVPDVLDVFVTDNVLPTVDNYGATNYPLAAHSVYVGVVGGDDLAIGLAIKAKKDLGCDMNGNTTVTVTDDNYSYPKPTYVYKFNRPTALPVLFSVQLAASTSLPSDIVAQVRAAIVASFDGVDGTARERMGGLVVASKYVGPVSRIGPEVIVLSLLIGTATPTLNSVAVGIDQVPTIDPLDIDVVLV